jgi:formylglycine-generating enzyme required for sulfatase activity
MPRVFICYRREDSSYPAQWIREELARHFGAESVVFDIDTIPLGTDFRKYLDQQVARCDAFLAVIGDRWMEMLTSRLGQPDFVHIEIEAALERDIPVVPVLVGKASMPGAEDLPPALADLAYRNAAEVRAGVDLGGHLKRLRDGLDKLFTKPQEVPPPEPVEGGPTWATPKSGTTRDQTTGFPKEVVDKQTGIEMVLIPAGKYMRGASPDDGEAYDDEKPAHEVTISTPFYLGKYEVTRGEWAKVMGSNPSSFAKGDRHPAEQVSWNDVQGFLEKTGFRLPTEAEWEYACRAGTKGARYEDSLDRIAWYGRNSGDSTHPVGKKEANAWGLHDMLGNVFEWCSDRYSKDEYDRCQEGVTDPEGPDSGTFRVVRGGSWDRDAGYCRSSYRPRARHPPHPHRFSCRQGSLISFALFSFSLSLLARVARRDNLDGWFWGRTPVFDERTDEE